MSGDVQPRKRKDKKKKKDELGVEDPRGTAAALGDGDVFIHSQQDHGTGGHWCAKIIFFSLLAVLITLIGLIILENRGLTELEANAVESRYSGVLEGWLEDTPDDDHHDAHTLDLKHHEDEGDDEHDIEESNHEDEEDHDDEEDQESDHEDEEDHDGEEDQESEHDDEEDHDEEEDSRENIEQDDDEDESQEENTQDDEDEEENAPRNEEQDADNDDNQSEENLQQDDNEDAEEQEDTKEDEDDEEVEKIEKEVVYDNEYDQETSKEDEPEENDDDEDDLQGQEEDDEPPLERITSPPVGKPFVEIEEEVIEKPINTLAEEEEYEKQQEQLRKEEEEAAQGSQIWLKLAVGGALLVATHAVLRRATAPRDIPEPEEEHDREETPIVDRRMTLVPEQSSPRLLQEIPVTQTSREVDEQIFKKPFPVTKSSPIVKQDSEKEVIVKKVTVEEKTPVVDTKDEEKELYSDEEVEDEEEEEEEDIEEPVKETIQKKAAPIVEQKSAEDSEPEDVEIIDEEQVDEELEEEDEDEEEISDVDDTELLSRLEAKYGRLPEPERFGQKPDKLEQNFGRFGQKHKDGGNSIEDDWPGEPSDEYWRTELNVAEEELRQGAWSACEQRAGAPALDSSARARWLTARALDLTAEARRDNRLLTRAIAAYLHLLKMNERLSDKKLLEVAQRTIDRIQFRGTYLSAEPIYRLLIRRFPDNVHYRNNLTVSFLMANRADLADEVLKETLRLWPDDRIALAHHGFVLKTKYNKLEEAVTVLYKALEGDTGAANEPRFYYHLGDALLLLGRFEEAHEVHKRGAALGHFLSPSQRSLYNVPRLRGRPWWPVEETPYVKLARALEKSWRDILKEGEAAKALYEKEKEGLKERGDWSQLDLFVRGGEIPGRCARAPVTCGIVRAEAAAAGCRRGQVKFSAMAAGTHVRPHVGPTNCRLRMHLGLSNTKDTYIRVDKDIKQWQTGKTFIFDDSFEHEVWHNGTGSRLVLIVDVWHPELTAKERRTLPAI
ncbi:aspartyl/asparaginyl beta-hydroxylase isoform X2 [Bicyclus anynana]|uniref:Aspartyl/asparaginyl beta-hydroxylase isoform X2 n=1 Tax=Bicyclus anynana TaxID=110368 RepID=A0ABM3M5Q1_BICAN|nr:aspartyl/asparaginyl beta-hydroxylase isoform X2 [Bicyclus anynana]